MGGLLLTLCWREGYTYKYKEVRENDKKRMKKVNYFTINGIIDNSGYF